MNRKFTDVLLKVRILIFSLCALPFLSSAQLNVTFTFNPDNACSETQIQFVSNVEPPGSTYIYNWNFGDATTSNLMNPTHVYNATGCNEQLFNVTLTVTDTSGGGNVSDSYSDDVTVKRRPAPQLIDLDNEPDFNNCDHFPTPSDPDFTIRIQNTTANNGCITSYTIDRGDGSPLLTNLTNTDFPIPYTYTQLGAFDLTITAYGSNGCQGTNSYLVKNQSIPGIGLDDPGNTSGCAPQTFPFTLTDYEDDSPGTEYLWNFGDGSTTVLWNQDSAEANTGTIYHTYQTTSCIPPDYQFTMSVTAYNTCGSKTMTSSNIIIWSYPVANFDPVPNQGCVNTTCFSFSNTTLAGYWGSSCIDTTHFQWDFGNGNTSTLPTPPCQYYNSTGNYTISLTATNECGSTSMSKVISVQDIPVAIAAPDQDNGCVPFEVNLANTSTGIGIQYEWNIVPSTGWSYIIGNAQSKNPIIRFTSAGTYTVTLTVANACESDDISFTILAKDKPSINIPDIADNCVDFIYNGNVIFNTNGSQITSFHWSVNPPNGWNFVPPSTADSANPDIRFSVAGSYQLTVQATNECGTASQLSNAFDIVTLESVDAGNDTTVCQYSDGFHLTGNPTGGTWSGINVTPPDLFTPDSSGVFMLTYSRGTGSCLSLDQLQITVISAPVVNAGADLSLCADDIPVMLSGQSSGGIWSGDGITDSISGIFDHLV